MASRAPRLSLRLFESNERECPEFNYRDLVSKSGVGEEAADVRRIARQFEQKYGTGRATCGKRDEYADIGAGYDESDSFIDNTDGYDEIIPPECDTACGGFYINSGSLEFKRSDPSALKDKECRLELGGAPQEVRALVLRLKRMADAHFAKHTAKLAGPTVNEIILGLELQCKRAKVAPRCRHAVFECAANLLRRGKAGLMQRARRLADDHRSPLARLRSAVDDMRPELLAHHERETQKILAFNRSVRHANKDRHDDDRLPERRLPKRRFPWNDRVRALLRDALKENNIHSHELTLAFLQNDVLPLFPAGFVRMPTLLQQIRNAKLQTPDKPADAPPPAPPLPPPAPPLPVVVESSVIVKPEADTVIKSVESATAEDKNGVGCIKVKSPSSLFDRDTIAKIISNKNSIADAAVKPDPPQDSAKRKIDRDAGVNFLKPAHKPDTNGGVVDDERKKAGRASVLSVDDSSSDDCVEVVPPPFDAEPDARRDPKDDPERADSRRKWLQSIAKSNLSSYHPNDHRKTNSGGWSASGSADERGPAPKRPKDCGAREPDLKVRRVDDDAPKDGVIRDANKTDKLSNNIVPDRNRKSDKQSDMDQDDFDTVMQNLKELQTLQMHGVVHHQKIYDDSPKS